MVGRNDDYGGNFRYRIETALDHFALKRSGPPLSRPYGSYRDRLKR